MTTLWILNRINKGNKSCITDDIVTKLNVHSCVISIHNCFKFYKILLHGCLLITLFVEFKAIQE